MVRKSIPPKVQAQVLLKSKRRCALCFGINQDCSERFGQIAHLNGNHADNQFENLVWLCLEHHDRFDSTTSQTKNYTQREVRIYRDNLYQSYDNLQFDDSEVEAVRNYLREYSSIFHILFSQYSDIVDSIDYDLMRFMTELRDSWIYSNFRSFNPTIRNIQDQITNNIIGLRSLYSTDMYNSIGSYITFNTKDFSKDILIGKKQRATEYIDSIKGLHNKLENIAIK